MAEVSKIAQGINKEEFEEMFNEHLKEDQVTLAVHIDHFALTQQLYTGGAGIIKPKTYGE